MIHRRNSTRVVSALAFLILLPSGCKDERRHGANNGITVEETAAPVAADAQPGDVATALLAALGRAQEARAHGLGKPERRKAYEKAVGEIQSLTAKKEVVENLRSAGSTNIAKDISDNTALTLITESWISLVAHYVKGVMPETLRVLPGGTQTIADVHVLAESPEDLAVLASLPTSSAPSHSPATSQAARPPRLDGATRAEAIRRGVNPLLRADIQIHLKNVDGRWLATGVNIGPAGMTFLPVAPVNAASTQAVKP